MSKTALFASLLIGSAPALAEGQLDQTNVPSQYLTNLAPLNSQVYTWGQTVTAGKTGLVDRIDLGVVDRADLTFTEFTIYASDGKEVGSKIRLGTGTFAGYADGFATFKTSFFVDAGQQYLIAPRGNAVWERSLFTEGSTYSDGDALYWGSSETGWLKPQTTPYDRLFKTYVDSNVTFGITQLDQTNVPSQYLTNLAPLNSEVYTWGQTVTAGMTGRVDRIDLGVVDRADLAFTEFTIYASDGNGIGSDTVLGTGTFEGYADGFASFKTAFIVEAGQHYLIAPKGNAVWERSLFTEGSTYSGGEALYWGSSETGWFKPQTSAYDRLFRTYMSPLTMGSAVPELATWAMMLIGFSTVGAGMRRRNLRPATR